MKMVRVNAVSIRETKHARDTHWEFVHETSCTNNNNNKLLLQQEIIPSHNYNEMLEALPKNTYNHMAKND